MLASVLPRTRVLRNKCKIRVFLDGDGLIPPSYTILIFEFWKIAREADWTSLEN